MNPWWSEKKIFRDINGSRQSLRSTKSSTTLLHDAEVDPTELEEVAVELDAAPEDEDEPGNLKTQVDSVLTSSAP
jgi:hypothetical protein